jgi:hypothetical protein
MEPNRRLWKSCRGLALLAAAGLLGGCGGGTGAQNPTSPSGIPPSTDASLPPAVAQAVEDKTAVNPGIVNADNTFGLNLFKPLGQGSTVNVAVSPTSIALVLQIILNGASGTTQPAMSQTLQLEGMSAIDINNANAALQAALVNPDPSDCARDRQLIVDAS